jgi:hypothetical protein
LAQSQHSGKSDYWACLDPIDVPQNSKPAMGMGLKLPMNKIQDAQQNQDDDRGKQRQVGFSLGLDKMAQAQKIQLDAVNPPA